MPASPASAPSAPVEVAHLLVDVTTAPARYREAFDSLSVNNPMPAVMGRVCYHPCETACNRG